MIRPSESSTSSCIESRRNKECRTLFGLHCVGGYLLVTKASWEHNRIQAGVGTATWAAVCCSWLRRLFRRLTRVDQLKTFYPEYEVFGDFESNLPTTRLSREVHFLQSD